MSTISILVAISIANLIEFSIILAIWIKVDSFHSKLYSILEYMQRFNPSLALDTLETHFNNKRQVDQDALVLISTLRTKLHTRTRKGK